MTRKILLICGIVSSLLYVAMNVFVPMQWEGYSSASQTVSELSAIGAPTRPLWVPLGVAYTLLVAAFGWGVWASARQNRPRVSREVCWWPTEPSASPGLRCIYGRCWQRAGER